MTSDVRQAPIDLAHEGEFELGGLTIRPAMREVVRGEQHQTLEPRVMQVLVALARHRGEIVSRNDLIQSCWNGRAVSEDAINRCIFGLRRLAEQVEGFAVQTVPRVGYRLQAAETPDPAPGAPTLAVLAFDNLSGDADMAYFSDGISEEILQTVANTTGLRVIGRSSSFQFRGAEKGARRVAAELGCTHVLDGSVRRSGARVRIAAQLIECADQTTLWSERFDRELADVFALQDEIARAIAQVLKTTFAPTPHVGPVDPVAFDLYLRARSSTPGHHGAFDADLLQEATQRAPGFAQAWAALAITRALQAQDMEREVGFERQDARIAAETALSLDRTAGVAYAALALLEPVCGRFMERQDLFEKALAVSPDDQVVLEKYSRWLHGVGRSRDALAMIARARELDPAYHQGANWYGVMISLERPLEALEVWAKARARWPQFGVLYLNPLNMAVALEDWRRVDEMVATIAQAGVNSAGLRDAHDRAETARLPGPERRARSLEDLHRQWRETGAVSLLTAVAAYNAGAHDEVFEVLGKASFDHLFRPGGRLADYGLHVLFNRHVQMRADVRFVGLCAKLGLCDYWLRSGRWPDCADSPLTTYDFRAEARRLAAH